MSTPAASPNRRGPRPRFTKEEVVRQALTLLDNGDPTTFSIRQLADALGIGAMTVYGYVRNKQELYEAVCQLAFAELGAPTDLEGPWEDRVRAAVGELHAFCQRHPHLVTLALTDTQLRPSLFTRRARILDALEEAGFPEPVALRTLGALISMTVGFAVSKSSALRELPADVDEVAELYSLSHVAKIYSGHLDDEAFSYGVELLIRGLRADLERVYNDRDDQS
jgi:AcrR family transcriptional regulator